MTVTIYDFIDTLEKEFDDVSRGTLKPETIIASVIEMSSINSLIFLALIKTEYGKSIKAGALINSVTIEDLYMAVFHSKE